MKSFIASFAAARSRPAGSGLAAVVLGLVLGCASSAACAAASLADSINALRARGCSGSAGVRAPLKQARALDAVAHQWSKGGRLAQALERADYRQSSASSMHVSGARDDKAVVAMLADSFCKIVTDASFTEIGIERTGRDVWLVVAAPLNLPSVQDARSIQRDVLKLVNAARAQPRRCGRTAYPAAPPLQLSEMLNRAALIHAQDMARHDHFEHVGTDGSTPAERIARVGYRWRNVAENIAAGAPTAATVVDGWIKSPGHCANIMGADYKEMGIAFATEAKSDAGIYWSQEFATSR